MSATLGFSGRFNGSAQDGGGVDAPLIPSAGNPEANYRRLYLGLTRQDDEPAHLIAAERCLCLRLQRLPAAAPEFALDRAAAAGPSSAQASAVPRVPDRDLLPPLPAWVDWLTTEPVVLQRIAQAATGEDPVHLLLFQVHRRWRAAAADLRRGAEHGAAALAGTNFEAASIRHALSCSPGARLPEIIGYLRAALERLTELSTTGNSRGGVAAAPADPPCALSPTIGSLIRELPAVQRALNLWLDSCAMNGSGRVAAMERLALGAALHESLWLQVVAADRRRQEHRDDPVLAFVQGLCSRARYAAGYHPGIPLAGRSLDDWFSEEPFDSDAFLHALADSPWVDRVHPERSRILRLLEFQGPMFGIFSPAEYDGLRAWLDAVSRSTCVAGTPVPREALSSKAPAPESVGAEGIPRGRDQHQSNRTVSGHRGLARSGDAAMAEVGRSIRRRNLFHRLLHVESDPAALVLARAYAAHCLAAAAGHGFWRRPFPYRAETFTGWIEQQYRKQLQGLKQARRTPRLSRAAYRFGIEQLAPAILVDGCWLQRAEQLHADSPEVARRLLTIYGDEFGNGVIEHNHPHVYRRLLESLGMALPPVASLEFAEHPCFLDAAFDLPTFLLSISLSPHRFLPELLGLNLAIELSGLGASYSRMARELEHWGIDATIVRLHQSIDNLASGHAALARDCVMIHLDQMQALGGEPTVQQHWSRIWSGYRSLGTVTRRFRWELVARYGLRAGSDWLSRLALFGRRKSAFSGAG